MSRRGKDLSAAKNQNSHKTFLKAKAAAAASGEEACKLNTRWTWGIIGNCEQNLKKGNI